jgi:hypothetical protein
MRYRIAFAVIVHKIIFHEHMMIFQQKRDSIIAPCENVPRSSYNQLNKISVKIY